MHVHRFSSLDELEPYAHDWDRLSNGVPFRSWAWSSIWWKHYGAAPTGSRRVSQLYVLAVFDNDEQLVGLAPWYTDYSAGQGLVVRWLGSGEVCSDYLAVLCVPGTEEQVTATLADFLTEKGLADANDPDRWDLLELTGFDAQERSVLSLADQLAERGNSVHRRPGPNCWHIPLPTTWDDYLKTLSKNHRSLIRRLCRRVLDTDRVRIRMVESLEDLPQALAILIDLHQKRWQDRGEPGCFASPRFEAFHREVSAALLLGGQLALCWLELDGTPVAVEYGVRGAGVFYGYQAGIDPDRRADEPGRLLHAAMLRWGIQQGFLWYDLLRGDEPYKAHWRAESRPSLELRIAPDRLSAQLRHNLWLTGSRVKRWMKSHLVASGKDH